MVDCSPEGHQPDIATRIFPGVQQPICITIVLRDGSTDVDTPAPVHFASVEGERTSKFAQLGKLELDDDGWVECATGAIRLDRCSGWSTPTL